MTLNGSPGVSTAQVRLAEFNSLFLFTSTTNRHCNTNTGMPCTSLNLLLDFSYVLLLDVMSFLQRKKTWNTRDHLNCALDRPPVDRGLPGQTQGGNASILHVRTSTVQNTP